MNIEELEIVLAHDLEADWIIALWLYIHGGDPGPEENQLTGLLAKSFATQMRERFPQLTRDPVAIVQKLNRLGITVKGRLPDKREFELKDRAGMRKFAEALSMAELPYFWHCFVESSIIVCIHHSLNPLVVLPLTASNS
jgi:hypothetical protein